MVKKLSNRDFWLAVDSGQTDFSNSDLSEVTSLTDTRDDFFRGNISFNPRWKSWKGYNFSDTVFFQADAPNGGIDVMWSNLAGANLQSAKAKGIRAGTANFSGSNLRKTDIGLGWLYMTDFSHADLREANLFQVDLVASKLAGAKLNGAFLHRATFANNTDLTSADLSDSILVEAPFNPIKTKGLKLDRTDMRLAILRGGYFANVSFRGADLRGANLSWANICGADFTGANVDLNTNFSDAYADDKTIWPSLWKKPLARWNIRVWTSEQKLEWLEKIDEMEREWEKAWK
jgi:uncharacterized protein YjbI with pentapeptide repeats